MNQDILKFEKLGDEFLKIFSEIPDNALAFKPKGDDYALGGLIVHVIDFLDYYGSVLKHVINASKEEIITAAHIIPEENKKLISDGIPKEKKKFFIDLCKKKHEEFVKNLKKISPANYTVKLPVIYKPSKDIYPTSPSDLLKWLTDHYEEHILQIGKMLKEKNNISSLN